LFHFFTKQVYIVFVISSKETGLDNVFYDTLGGRQTKAGMLIAKIKTLERNTTINDSLHLVLLYLFLFIYLFVCEQTRSP